MKHAMVILVTCFSVMLPLLMPSSSIASDVPKDGFVPNQQTAVRIAEAVLIPIYGKNEVERERPYTAIINNGVWTVTGTLSSELLGGVATIEIAKESGCILRVTHGK